MIRVLLFIALLSSTLVIFGPGPAYDEAAHLGTILEIRQILAGALPFSEYKEVKAPLSFVIWAIIGAPFDWNLTVLRVFTFLFSLGALGFLWRICRQLKVERPWYFVALFWFMPKTFLSSALVMSEPISFFFLLGSLDFYLRSSNSTRNLIAAAAFSTAATWTRQPLIAIAGAFGLNELRRFHELGVKRLSLRLAILSLPVLSLGVLWYYWGGLVPPYRRVVGNHALVLTLEHLTLLLVCAGFYLAGLGRALRPHPVFLALLPIFFIWPIHSYEPEQGISQLQVWSIPTQIANALSTRLDMSGVSALFLGFFFVIGAWVITQLLSQKLAGRPRFLMSVTLALLLLSTLSINVAAERYYLQMIPFFLLGFVKVDSESARKLNVWLTVLLMLSCSYSVYRVYSLASGG